MAMAVSHNLLPRRSAFDSWSVHVGFVVDIVTLVQYFLQVLRFCPVSVIPPVFHPFIRSRSNPIGGRDFPHPSRLALEVTQSLDSGVLDLFPWVKAAGAWH